MLFDLKAFSFSFKTVLNIISPSDKNKQEPWPNPEKGKRLLIRYFGGAVIQNKLLQSPVLIRILAFLLWLFLSCKNKKAWVYLTFEACFMIGFKLYLRKEECIVSEYP